MNGQLTPEQFFARLFRDEDQRDARSRGPLPHGHASVSLFIGLERGSDGRIVHKIEADGQGRDAIVYDYVYDEGGRLALVLRDGVEVERYEYDAAGRRIAACCEASAMRRVELEYDGMRLPRCGDTSYGYADDGTLRELRGREGSLRLLYGPDTGLDRAALPDGRMLTWDTDAKTGQPLAKYEDGALVERFAWRDLMRLERYEDLHRGVRQHYHYAEHSRLPHAMTEHNSLQSHTYTLGYDQVGTLKTVADDDGKLVKKRQYDSFGIMLQDSNPHLYIPIGFAGGLHDGDTNLVRFGHRDYDPRCGRFVAQDPLGDTGGDHDLYEYCVDDPINAIDPLGLKTGDWWDVPANLNRAIEIGNEELRKRGKGNHNNSGDAMRHAEWSRRMAEEIGPVTSWIAGTANEAKGLLHGQPWGEAMMDLHNNAEGRAAAKEKRPVDKSRLKNTPHSTSKINPYKKGKYKFE